MPASSRAGHRFSSMFSASRSCFSSLIWSSVSSMVKDRLEVHQLGMAAQDLDADGVEGAEPGHALDHARRSAAPTRLFISRAALLVKVTARICDGRRPAASSKCGQSRA